MGKFSKTITCILLIIIYILTSCTPANVNNQIDSSLDNNDKVIEDA